MTNKYAEGYPGKRYYGGCEFVDIVENLAIERCKQLFGADHVNVQPHSGTQANMAVYFAAAQARRYSSGNESVPRRPFVAWQSRQLFRVNFIKSFLTVLTKIRKPLIMTELEKLAKEHKPKMIIVGASAYPRTIDFARFRQDCRSSRRRDHGRYRAYRRTWLRPDCIRRPVPVCEYVTTTTHKTLRGPRGGLIMCKGSLRQNLEQPGLSRDAGWPADARHRRQSRGL